MNYYNKNDHCFVICAYKENKYLEECILSLLNQEVKTNILIETSTPNNYISSLANKYNLKIIVNNDSSSCAKDWNFAVNNVPYKLITIAHQDDIYYSNYAKEIISYANQATDPIMLFTDYDELINDKTISSNTILFIKRLLSYHMRNKKNWNKQKARKRLLCIGNAISCPTVTVVKEMVGDSPYDESMKCNCDYKTWVNHLKQDGSYVYVPKHLIAHRIYKDSSTSLYIKDNTRAHEDKEIISYFWPKPISTIIYKIYSLSQKHNTSKIKI